MRSAWVPMGGAILLSFAIAGSKTTAGDSPSGPSLADSVVAIEFGEGVSLDSAARGHPWLIPAGSSTPTSCISRESLRNMLRCTLRAGAHLAVRQ
jgi:hypothetical protein